MPAVVGVPKIVLVPFTKESPGGKAPKLLTPWVVNWVLTKAFGMVLRLNEYGWLTVPVGNVNAKPPPARAPQDMNVNATKRHIQAYVLNCRMSPHTSV